MPNFLLGIEFNQEAMLLAVAISFVISIIFIFLIIAPLNRSRLNQLRTRLEKDILSSEQQRMELGSELNNVQQKIQQTELKVTAQTAQIAELEKEKQAAQAEAIRAAGLELSLNQKKQEFAQLAHRLQDSEKNLASLQQIWEARLAEKDTEISSLTSTLNQQAQQSEQNLQELQAQLNQSQQTKLELQTELSELQQAKLEQQQQLETVLQETQAELDQTQQGKLEQQQVAEKNLQQLQAELDQTQQVAEKNLQQLQAELAQIQQSKLEQQQQLEGTILQVERLEQRLADRSAKSESVKSPEILEQQQTIERLQESHQALEKKLLESEAAINELVAKNAKKPATVESELTQKIAELNTALAEQNNYIFRLEYDLDVKKALISDKNSPLKTIPAAIIAKQEQAEARIIELEQQLNPKRKVVKKTVEKAQSTSSELLNPAKQQIDEIADKAKYLPNQFKGFYQKILPKKTEEASKSATSESITVKKPQPEKNKLAEKSVVEKAESVGGLRGFFKKLDNQTEVITPPTPSNSKKYQPEIPIKEETPTKSTVSLEGLKGFFKKLDKQAEVK